MAFTLAACGGGGGGGGSFSKVQSGDLHNDSGSGGWGTGATTGAGLGGSGGGLGSGGSSEIVITGSTPLEVSGYTYNGATYSDVQSLVQALLENGTTEDVFYVDFNVEGESAPRTARIRANSAANPGDALTIDYQYKATYSIPSAAGAAATPQEVFYYKRDGITIELPELSNSDYATPDGDGIAYHANKWNVQGQAVSSGSVHINASGDVVIDDITTTADRTYGFSETQVIVNDTGTVTIDNTGRSGSITEIQLPASGSVELDLSGVTNLSLQGSDPSAPSLSSNTSPAIINKDALTSITLPESSYSLGDYALAKCTNLSGSIDLSNCTSIGKWAFAKCSGLTGSIDLSNCTSIGNSAFSDCSGLTSVTLPNTIVSIGGGTFGGCTSLTSIDLSNCTSIGSSSFEMCSGITSVDLSNCTSIGNYAFYHCTGLTSIDLSNCTSIGEVAFNGCTALTSVTFPNTAFTIESSFNLGTFQNSGLSGAIDLSNCTSIGDCAFSSCTGISGSIDLSNCTSIGEYAFYGCTGITSVTFGSGVTTIGYYAFRYVDATFVFNSDPRSGITYNVHNGSSQSSAYSSFKSGVTATWDDGTMVHTYTWGGANWVEN